MSFKLKKNVMFLKITISSELPAVRWTKNMALSKSCEKVETLRFRIVYTDDQEQRTQKQMQNE